MEQEQKLVHFFAFCLQTLHTTLPPEKVSDADEFLVERIGETYQLFLVKEITYDDALNVVTHFFKFCCGDIDVVAKWKRGEVDDLSDLVQRIKIAS